MGGVVCFASGFIFGCCCCCLLLLFSSQFALTRESKSRYEFSDELFVSFAIVCRVQVTVFQGCPQLPGAGVWG